MSKNRILTWVVVLLVTMNVVTIGTILYHNYQENQKRDDIGINSGFGVNMLNGRFFRQSLGFDEQQMDSFRDLNQKFRPYAMDLVYGVDSLKNQMFNELQKVAPDTVKLNSISGQIGELHGRLKYETYKFYLGIRQVCTPAQTAELEKVFQPLFKSEGITTPPNYPRSRGPNRN
ncbi:MAG: Spy/CpxP family protein refolding chaperone [Bacteroidia bacterium]